MKKATFLFILLSVFASAVNYAAYPVLSRILPASQYTDITVSLSLLTQITTFLSSIVALTIGISKSYGHDEATKRIESLQSLLFRLFVSLSVVFLAVSPFLMASINTPAAYALPICIMMLGAIPVTIISGYLNGKNLMVKVGFVAVITASLQFATGALTALYTKNGVSTMLLMGVAQVISIFILYTLFSSQRLPSPRTILTKLQLSSPTMRKLALYTLFASISIMIVNLLQVADLVIVKELRGVDVKLYTDMYVVSRIVFFAGMIFIWPFLGQLRLDDHAHNVRLLVRVIGVFGAISALAVLALLVGGPIIADVLFGSHYAADVINLTGSLSIIYKLLLLIITAVSLYMIVMRRYLVVVVAAVATIAAYIATLLIGNTASINSALISLDAAMGLVAVLSLILALMDSVSRKAAKQVRS